jgi:transcriptional regulator with XRE-family HTH domain
MGRSAREKPRKLGKKLKHIRVVELGLSQTQMAEVLKLKINYSAIGQYERGVREPTLPILLKYARLIGISTDILIDDKLELRANTGKKF